MRNTNKGKKTHDKPELIADEFGLLSYDKEEPLRDLVTWVFDKGSFKPTAKLINGECYSIITDHLGTPKEAYNSSGERVWECELTGYGKVKKCTDTSFIPFRFQGQYHDLEIGNTYHQRYRYYFAEEGMYAGQKDPLSVNGGFALYGYVHDPNAWMDVFGLECNITKVGLDHDLAQEAQNFRKENPFLGKTKRNVAVIEFEGSDGLMKKSAFSVPETGEHAEEMLLKYIKDNNISPDKVTRIYSELDYCTKCQNLIKQTLPNLEEQAYSFIRKTEYNDIFTDYVKTWIW